MSATRAMASVRAAINSADCVSSACIAEPDTPHNAITGIPSQNNGPVGATPKIRKPIVPLPSSSSSAQRSPNRLTIGPDRRACTAIRSRNRRLLFRRCEPILTGIQGLFDEAQDQIALSRLPARF